LGFGHLKDIYCDDPDFKEAYEECSNHVLMDRIQRTMYMIQYVLMFKGFQLCIQRCSMRENLLMEKQSEGLAGHFSHDKTFAQLNNSYYWTCMRAKVKKFVNTCNIFHYAKENKHHTRFYHPLPIPDRP
jgi:hypothetical protein